MNSLRVVGIFILLIVLAAATTLLASIAGCSTITTTYRTSVILGDDNRVGQDRDFQGQLDQRATDSLNPALTIPVEVLP